MRLIRQYRTDQVQLALKLAGCGVALACIYILFSATANVFAGTYYSSQSQERDSEILNGENENYARLNLDERIANRQSLLPKLHDKAVIGEVKVQLAGLYSQKAAEYISEGMKSSAEHAYQEAMRLDPANAKYPRQVAQFYADAAVEQSLIDNRITLLKSSSDYFQQALDREPDQNSRRYLAEKEASTSLSAAKSELQVPNYKLAAIGELEHAKKVAPPGTPIAQDIDQLLLLENGK